MSGTFVEQDHQPFIAARAGDLVVEIVNGAQGTKPNPFLDTRYPIPTPWERCSVLPSLWSAGATATSAFWNSRIEA